MIASPERFEIETSFGGDAAIFSPGRRYRYALVRCPRGRFSRTIAWVMLNPSTGDAFRNDATLIRVIRRSYALGYDRVVVLNLYALRSTNPRALRTDPDPVGPENDEAIRRFAGEADEVVAAWGSLGRPERVARVLELVDRPLVCLGTTSGGAPRHPLYVRTGAALVGFDPAR